MPLRSKIQPGQTYGRLTTIKPLYRDERGHMHWLCECVCGKRTTPDGTDLTKPHLPIRSCGCSRPSQPNLHKRKVWRENKRAQRQRHDPRSTISRWCEDDRKAEARAAALAPPPLPWEL